MKCKSKSSNTWIQEFSISGVLFDCNWISLKKSLIVKNQNIPTYNEFVFESNQKLILRSTVLDKKKRKFNLPREINVNLTSDFSLRFLVNAAEQKFNPLSPSLRVKRGHINDPVKIFKKYFKKYGCERRWALKKFNKTVFRNLSNRKLIVFRV